jgi:hypothetical protein
MALDINSLSDQSIELKGKMKDALAKATGQAVALINVLKTKRTAGVSVRPVEFVLGGNQIVTFLIRQGGDVYRVQINGKDMPINGDLNIGKDGGAYTNLTADKTKTPALSPDSRKQDATKIRQGGAGLVEQKGAGSVFKQIGDAIRSGQLAFEKKLGRQKVVIPKDPNKATPKNTAQQLKVAKEAETELLATIATKTQQRDDLKTRVEQKRAQAA